MQPGEFVRNEPQAKPRQHLCYVYASLSRRAFRGLPGEFTVVFEGVIGFSTAKKPTALMMHWWNTGVGGVCPGDQDGIYQARESAAPAQQSTSRKADQRRKMTSHRRSRACGLSIDNFPRSPLQGAPAHSQDLAVRLWPWSILGVDPRLPSMVMSFSTSVSQGCPNEEDIIPQKTT